MRFPHPTRSLAAATALALLFTMPAPPGAAAPKAAAPDLTVPGAAATIDKESRKWTYNLGPTGMRGWIYHFWSLTAEQDATTAFAPYQILVTSVADKTPAAGVLAADDVILGASAGAGTVPLFTGDARKSLGRAIGAAEANNWILKLKRWRAGVTTEVSITLPVMGAYSDTAPYACPKSAMIMANAASNLQQKILKNGWGGADGSGAISALALLATGNPEYLPMLQTYARTLAPTDLDLERNGVSAWNCYNSIYLAEYYMLTKDSEVLHGLSEYVVYAAKHTSRITASTNSRGRAGPTMITAATARTGWPRSCSRAWETSRCRRSISPAWPWRDSRASSMVIPARGSATCGRPSAPPWAARKRLPNTSNRCAGTAV